jgi:hypothetical protein
MATTIHMNDIGTVLQVTVKKSGAALDVSSATDMTILLQDPSGTKKQLTASFSTDGTDGLIEAKTVDGTIDAVGIWGVQGWVEFGTDSFHTDSSTFEVLTSLLP